MKERSVPTYFQQGIGFLNGKRTFLTEFFSIFQIVLKPVKSNFSKMYYIGKSMTVKSDITPRQQKMYRRR